MVGKIKKVFSNHLQMLPHKLFRLNGVAILQCNRSSHFSKAAGSTASRDRFRQTSISANSFFVALNDATEASLGSRINLASMISAGLVAAET